LPVSRHSRRAQGTDVGLAYGNLLTNRALVPFHHDLFALRLSEPLFPSIPSARCYPGSPFPLPTASPIAGELELWKKKRSRNDYDVPEGSLDRCRPFKLPRGCPPKSATQSLTLLGNPRSGRTSFRSSWRSGCGSVYDTSIPVDGSSHLFKSDFWRSFLRNTSRLSRLLQYLPYSNRREPQTCTSPSDADYYPALLLESRSPSS
jgi:hypothetical protein